MKTMRPTRPPKSTRYCPVCEENTKWKYNPLIGHSCCTECGSRFGKRPKNGKSTNR